MSIGRACIQALRALPEMMGCSGRPEELPTQPNLRSCLRVNAEGEADE